MSKRLALGVVLLLATKCLFAQFPMLVPPVQPEMAWDGDSIVISEAHSFIVQKPDAKEPITIPLPPGTVDNRFAQNYFWIVAQDESNRCFRVSRSEDGQKWEYLASLPWSDHMGVEPQAQRFYLHPLGRDAFLLVARAGSWFTVNRAPCAAVVAKINAKKTLEISSAIDFGFREKMVRKEGDKIIFNDHYIWFLSGTIGRPFMTVGDRVFLAFRRIGMFMEIRPNGTIGKRFQIIPGLDEKAAMDPDSYDWAALCSQPTKDGEILVLARTEEGVLEGRKYYPRVYSDAAMNDAALGGAISRADAEALRAYPFMDWLKLDPASGKMYQTAPPRNTPTYFDSIDTFRKFVFRFDTAENLVFPLLKN